jgi:hypothetical protein
MRGFDVLYKRLCTTHTARSGNTTGVTYGKGTEQIELYDRRERAESTDGPSTRLELRLRGAEIPFRKVSELPRLIEIIESGDYLPLSEVKLERIENVPRSSIKSKSQIWRVGGCDALISEMGIGFARRRLNQDRNFKKSYERFLERSDLVSDPTGELLRSLRAFFRGWKPEYAALEPQAVAS